MKKTIILFLILSFTLCLIPAFAVVSSAVSVDNYTVNVPIDSKISVRFDDSQVFLPTNMGVFRLYKDRVGTWSLYYQSDLKDILPSFFFSDGVSPVSIDFGMDVNVSWDVDFNVTGTNLNLDPSVRFVSNASYLYGFGSIQSPSPFIPYYLDYIQDGRSYKEDWEGNLRPVPYEVDFDFSCDISNVDTFNTSDTYFEVWIGSFQYNSVAGDSVNGDGYGLEFTIDDFYITFNYIDDRTAAFQDNIQNNDALGQSAMTWDDYFKNNPIPSFNIDMSGFAPVLSIFLSSAHDIEEIAAPLRAPYDISINGIRFDPIDIYIKVVTSVALLYSLIDVVRGVRSFKHD